MFVQQQVKYDLSHTYSAGNCFVMAFLLGCESPATADHTAPDLGECIGLAATLADGGPVAHVYVTEWQPCEGGTCNWQGECVP